MIDYGKVIDQAIPKALMPKPGSNRRSFPLLIHLIGATVTCALLIPPVVIWRARTATSRSPRIHIFHDMDHQQKFKAQAGNPLFIDNRAMRPPVENTVARGELRRDPHFFEGRRGDGWAAGLPAQYTNELGEQKTLVIDEAFMARGEERYGVFCAPCHGADGHGNGPVTVRALNGKAAGTAWTQPTNLHALPTGDPASLSPVEQPLGQLYNTITHGIRNMPGYGAQIPVLDRWRIVAHIKALQASQNPNP